jgi:DNA-binding NarL/FixJ family response regulator
MDKVILIEDDRLIREIYIFTLEKANFQVLSAVDGQEGIDLAKENPDAKLILLDIIMPKSHGVDILKRIKKTPEIAGIPVVLLSNLSDEKTVDEAIREGARGYIVKSQVSQDELVEKVKQVVYPQK